MSKFASRFLFVVCVLCLNCGLQAFAAPSVKKLGGANTYKGTVSAASAKTGKISKTVGRPASAKTMNAKPTSIVKHATAIGNSPNTSRLSVGKYLHNAGVNAGIIKKWDTNVQTATATSDLSIRMDDLENQINDKADKDVLNNYYDKTEVDNKFSDVQQTLVELNNNINNNVVIIDSLTGDTIDVSLARKQHWNADVLTATEDGQD